MREINEILNGLEFIELVAIGCITGLVIFGIIYAVIKIFENVEASEPFAVDATFTAPSPSPKVYGKKYEALKVLAK